MNLVADIWLISFILKAQYYLKSEERKIYLLNKFTWVVYFYKIPTNPESTVCALLDTSQPNVNWRNTVSYVSTSFEENTVCPPIFL